MRKAPLPEELDERADVVTILGISEEVHRDAMRAADEIVEHRRGNRAEGRRLIHALVPARRRWRKYRIPRLALGEVEVKCANWACVVRWSRRKCRRGASLRPTRDRATLYTLESSE